MHDNATVFLSCTLTFCFVGGFQFSNFCHVKVPWHFSFTSFLGIICQNSVKAFSPFLRELKQACLMCLIPLFKVFLKINFTRGWKPVLFSPSCYRMLGRCSTSITLSYMPEASNTMRSYSIQKLLKLFIFGWHGQLFVLLSFETKTRFKKKLFCRHKTHEKSSKELITLFYVGCDARQHWRKGNPKVHESIKNLCEKIHKICMKHTEKKFS